MLIAARAFCRIAKEAEVILNCAIAGEIDWDTAYDLIFSDDISRSIRSTGINFDYYDPDSSYQEDVCAYVNAVVDKASELRKVLDKLGE